MRKLTVQSLMAEVETPFMSCREVEDVAYERARTRTRWKRQPFGFRANEAQCSCEHAEYYGRIEDKQTRRHGREVFSLGRTTEK